MQVLFHFLNNGNDIDEDFLERFLKKVYAPSTSVVRF